MAALNLNRTNCKIAGWLAAFVLVAALAGPARTEAAGRQEKQDFINGTNKFNAGFYPQAEITFSNFVAEYTNSPYLPDAILFLARARLGLSNYAGALDLLREKLPADNATVLNYTAQAYYGAGDYTNAAATCARLLQKLSAGDPLILGVARLQAQARSKLQDWPGVIELLSNPNGVFQRAARADPGNTEVVDGIFLLGEAYLHEKRFEEGEAAVRQTKTNSMTPELQWKRDYLLTRILLEAGRTEEALTNSGELAALSPSQSEGIATAFLRGEIFERLHQTTNALDEYEKNLAQGLPAEINRQALIKTVELAPPAEASNQLAAVIARRPKDPNLDLALWYRGDQSLQAYFAPSAPDTNSPAAGDTNNLQEAITNLTQLTQDFPNSDLLGKARLDLGWSDWSLGRYAEAKTNFLQATEHLPFSEERAVAILKLADAQFKQGDFGDAARHYDQLLTDYAAMPGVTNGLFDRALYQLAQADIKLGDEKGAETAAARIVNEYRESGFGERSLLLLGENSSRRADYAPARAIFQNLLQAYPNTVLQPDIQFAIARTYEQEGDWSNAVSACENWLSNTNFASNGLQPQVAFARALDLGKAGQETNALAQMTNFVSQFQSSTLAPLAQNWIGDYYRNHGENAKADEAYQKLWVMFPDATNLIYQARLMAGRAAQGYDNLPQASNDFWILTDNTNTPAAIRGEAYLQLGYTDFLQFQANRTLDSKFFIGALNAVSQVTNAAVYPGLAPQALGQLGNCWLERAPLEKASSDKANDLNKAAQMFQAELDLPQSGVTARSQAEVGLGHVEEGLGHPEEALNHYLKVVFIPSEVLDEQLEKPDPNWVKEAGVAAWQMCEDAKKFDEAAAIYARVKAVVPTLGGDMDEKKVVQAVSIVPGSGN